MRDTFKYGHPSGQLRMLNCNVFSAAQQSGAGAIFFVAPLSNSCYTTMISLCGAKPGGLKGKEDMAWCVRVCDCGEKLMSEWTQKVPAFFTDQLHFVGFPKLVIKILLWYFKNISILKILSHYVIPNVSSGIRNQKAKFASPNMVNIYLYALPVFIFMWILLSLKYFAIEMNEFWRSVMGSLPLT